MCGSEDESKPFKCIAPPHMEIHEPFTCQKSVIFGTTNDLANLNAGGTLMFICIKLWYEHYWCMWQNIAVAYFTVQDALLYVGIFLLLHRDKHICGTSLFLFVDFEIHIMI